MSMNGMPAAERVHISFFGCRNAGKSSLVNAVTGQVVSVVSDVKGTTTDPVSKTMELLPLGPVVITDTPGFDDAGGLGSLRVERTRQILRRTDLAVLVVDSAAGLQKTDRELLRLFGERNIPFLVAMNKQDLCRTVPEDDRTVAVSALTGEGVRELKERMARLLPERSAEKRLIADLVRPGDCVVLVCPIDESAPKGRLILPQQHAIRDLLEAGALPLVTRETELPDALSALTSPPCMVVTDSQAFRAVAPRVPEEIPLTSFSILMARYRGFLETAVRGVAALRSLRDGNKKTVVIMTKEVGYVRKPTSNMALLRAKYHRYPGLVHDMARRHIVYNRTVKFIEEHEKKGHIFVIRPKHKSEVGRIEKDQNKLRALYEEGYEEATEILPKLKEYLGLC